LKFLFGGLEDLLGLCFLVQVRALLVHATSIFQKKPAVLCATEGGVHQSAIENVLVD
jgi:hypothetical protein